MKKLLLILTMSVMAVVVMSAETLTDEFKSSGWFTQTSAGNKSEITATSTTTNIEYSYFQCYKNASIGVMMCKNYESYLSLTAPFGVQKLEITVPKGASAKAVVDILANGNIIVSDLKFDQNSSAAHTYAVNIPEEYQAQGVKLTIKKQKLTKNDVNAQIGSVTVTKSEIQGSEDKVAKPTFTPSAGWMVTGTTVGLSCATDGASIHYTLDSTEPTSDSALYEEPIAVNENVTIKAIACKDGESSNVATAEYKVYPANSADSPLTVSQAVSLIDSGFDTNIEVYVAGTVTSATVEPQYKNATYVIKDEAGSEITVFRGKYLDGADFTSEDQIAVNDNVIVLGKLKDYNGTKEVDTGNILISLDRPVVPVTLGDIVVTYGDDNTPVENAGVLEEIVAGTVFNFSAANAESIVVKTSDGTTIASGTDSAQWIATVTAAEEITVTATKGDETKPFKFTIEVVPAPAPQLGDIVVTYGDGKVVMNDFDVLTTVNVGEVFSATADNAAHIEVQLWNAEKVFENDGSNISWTMTDPTKEEGVTVTATLGDESKEFMFRLAVVEPEIWTLVKTVDELVVGGKYIITNEEAAYAMSAENNANIRKITAITVSNDILKNPSSEVLQLELEKDGEDYMWRTVNYLNAQGEQATNQGYLNVASGSSNYLNVTNPQDENKNRRNTSVSFDGENVLITFVNALFKTGPDKRRIFFNNDRFTTYSETNEIMGKIKLFKFGPCAPMFDEKVGEKSVSFTAKNGELHAWVIEYDANDNVVKENDVDVAETPASIMAKAPAADNTSWTNKVAEENEEFVVTAPETEGNYKMIRAKAVYNGLHSVEVVRGITYDGGVLSGVEAVVAEDADAAVEYFNLQGVRVNAEQPGLYIRRQGNKVSKVVIR